MSASKRKGTEWETNVRDWLREQGHRRAARIGDRDSGLDRGDIEGLPGIVIQCKNERSIDLPGYLDETDIQVDNAHKYNFSRGEQRETPLFPVVFIRRRGFPDPGFGYAVMEMRQWLRLYDLVDEEIWRD